MPKPISVSTTILIALIRLWQYKKDLFLRLALPIAGSALLATMATTGDLTLNRYLVLSAVNLPLYTLIAVTCHRTVLLGVDAVPSHGIYWSSRESRFLLYLSAVSIGLGIAAATSAFLGVAIVKFLSRLLGLVTTPAEAIGIVFALAGFTLLFVVAKLSFLFPAIALEKKSNIRQSLADTRGNTFRVFALLLASLAASFLVSLAVRYISVPLGSIAEYMGVFLTSFFGASLSIAVVSIAYRDSITVDNG